MMLVYVFSSIFNRFFRGKLVIVQFTFTVSEIKRNGFDLQVDFCILIHPVNGFLIESILDQLILKRFKYLILFPRLAVGGEGEKDTTNGNDCTKNPF
jgi:hypothetical protein